jgi:hypothetical protein
MPPGFTEEQVVLILTSPLPAAVLGRQFGCSHQAVCDVRNNKTYRYIRSDIPRSNRYSTRRLKPENVAYIRDSVESNHTLAKRFGVSRRTIISARRGETYKNRGTPSSTDQPHCCNCKHWGNGCGLGFPEAEEDPAFAAECSLFLNTHH